MRGSMGAMVTMMLLLLAGLQGCMAFRAFDCNSQSSQIEQYSLLDPEPCGNMEKVHAIERELYGEIVQIKKERLVQVTRCTATETVMTQHCGWQSHAGPGRYAKFHDPITIEPADCRQAAKTGHIKSIAVFFHPMEQIEVASGKFNMVTTEAEFTRLESELSFLQVRSTMTLQETIRQVKAEICEDRKQIAHTRLDVVMSNQRFFKIVCFRFPTNVPKKIEHIRFLKKNLVSNQNVLFEISKF